MLILSGNTLTDTLRITSDQISRHSMAQSSWHIIWTIITTLAGNLDGGYRILRVKTGLVMENQLLTSLRWHKWEMNFYKQVSMSLMAKQWNTLLQPSVQGLTQVGFTVMYSRKEVAYVWWCKVWELCDSAFGK